MNVIFRKGKNKNIKGIRLALLLIALVFTLSLLCSSSQVAYCMDGNPVVSAINGGQMLKSAGLVLGGAVVSAFSTWLYFSLRSNPTEDLINKCLAQNFDKVQEQIDNAIRVILFNIKESNGKRNPESVYKAIQSLKQHIGEDYDMVVNASRAQSKTILKLSEAMDKQVGKLAKAIDSNTASMTASNTAGETKTTLNAQVLNLQRGADSIGSNGSFGDEFFSRSVLEEYHYLDSSFFTTDYVFVIIGLGLTVFVGVLYFKQNR